MWAKTLVMFKFFLKGRKTNIGKDKLKATYSVAW